MYGRSRKGARSNRGSGSRNYRKPYGSMLKAAPYTGRRGTYKTGLKFATVGFSRNVERKYFDKTYQANSIETETGQTSSFTGNNGVTYLSNTWGNYNFGSKVASAAVVSNDLLKGVATGTTARTRIGNKIAVKYVKGAFTFTAGMVDVTTVRPQNGEAYSDLTDGGNYLQYLRTSFRMVIVKDLQVNSTDTQVTWSQVFDTTNLQAGVHSELNVDNMGRFVVLEDKIFTLDADTPQRTIPYMISGNKLGSVRYNGPSDTALTDKGLYIVWAAFVMGANVGVNPFTLPSPVGHSRLCFTDD